MTQHHLDRLSAIDASFLAQEGPTTHMHIGGLAIFAGPPPSGDEFLAHVRSRLHLVPRYRQKLAVPPLDTGRPLWIDDPTFNLGYHVRHAALPPPGDEAALLTLAGRLFSQKLDRSKPLWELWLVEGLAGDGFAFISKTHHALVDGISGVDLVATLFDASPNAARVPEPGTWIPEPEPTPAVLAAQGLRGAAARALSVAGDTAQALTRPTATLGRARELVAAIGEVAWAGLNAAPDSPLNVAPGPHRRLAVVRADLGEFKRIKQTLGGTVNDVVLAVVAGGLRSFYCERGLSPDGIELKACVPVSVRPDESRGDAGNQLTQLVAPLPLHIADPASRLRYVREAMGGIKDSRQALGAEAIAALQDFAPPTLLAQASRMNFAARFYNLLVTNVPGPQVPLYLMGHPLEAMFPIAFLAGERALAVAIISYDGALNFGLLGDRDALPDLDAVARGIEEAIDELARLAARRRRSDARRVKRRAASSTG